MEILSSATTPGTRKLKAKWTVEAQDLAQKEFGMYPGGNPKFKNTKTEDVYEIYREALDKWIWETKNKEENQKIYQEAEAEIESRNAFDGQPDSVIAAQLAKDIRDEIDQEILMSLLTEDANTK